MLPLWMSRRRETGGQPNDLLPAEEEEEEGMEWKQEQAGKAENSESPRGLNGDDDGGTFCWTVVVVVAGGIRFSIPVGDGRSE